MLDSATMTSIANESSQGCNGSAERDAAPHMESPPPSKKRSVESWASRLRRLVKWNATEAKVGPQQEGISTQAYRFASSSGLVGMECRLIMHKLKATTQATFEGVEL
jgi:hypothetical protein